MEINPTPVDAGQAGAEGQQLDTTPTNTAADTGVTSAPATQTAKPVQDRETNAAFAKMRRETEELRKKLDDTINFAYEGKYKNYDAFEAERKAYEMRQLYENDPVAATRQTVDEAVNNHPAVKAANAFNAMRAMEASAGELAKLAPELGIKDAATLAAYLDENPEVAEMYERGVSAERAIFAVKGPEIMAQREAKARAAAQQETIKNLQQNAAATPGAVGTGADTPLVITEEELKHLDQKRLRSDPVYARAAYEANAARFKK